MNNYILFYHSSESDPAFDYQQVRGAEELIGEKSGEMDVLQRESRECDTLIMNLATNCQKIKRPMLRKTK